MNDFWVQCSLKWCMQKNVVSSVPRNGLHTSSVMCIGGSAHEGNGEWEESNCSCFIPACQHCFLVGREPDGDGQWGAWGLGSGQVCVDACPTSLGREKMLRLKSLHFFTIWLLICFLTRMLLCWATLLLLFVHFTSEGRFLSVLMRGPCPFHIWKK